MMAISAQRLAARGTSNLFWVGLLITFVYVEA
jgi:hypothetical protein